MSNRPKLVSCDTMNLWIETARSTLIQLLGRVDALIVNEDEAQQLTQTENIVDAAAAVKSMGPKSVVIKRGENGASLFGEGFMLAAPAYPVSQVIDPTGAGDSFAGGFMGYLSSKNTIDQNTLRTASIVGSTMASFAVEQFGLEGIRNLTQKDIENRFNDFVNLTRFNPLS